MKYQLELFFKQEYNADIKIDDIFGNWFIVVSLPNKNDIYFQYNISNNCLYEGVDFESNEEFNDSKLSQLNNKWLTFSTRRKDADAILNEELNVGMIDYLKENPVFREWIKDAMYKYHEQELKYLNSKKVEQPILKAITTEGFENIITQKFLYKGKEYKREELCGSETKFNYINWESLDDVGTVYNYTLDDGWRVGATTSMNNLITIKTPQIELEYQKLKNK